MTSRPLACNITLTWHVFFLNKRLRTSCYVPCEIVMTELDRTSYCRSRLGTTFQTVPRFSTKWSHLQMLKKTPKSKAVHRVHVTGVLELVTLMKIRCTTHLPQPCLDNLQRQTLTKMATGKLRRATDTTKTTSNKEYKATGLNLKIRNKNVTTTIKHNQGI